MTKPNAFSMEVASVVGNAHRENGYKNFDSAVDSIKCTANTQRYTSDALIISV